MIKKLTLFIIIFLLVFSGQSFANAGQPPSIVIMTMDAPKDLEVYLIKGEERIAFDRVNRLGEDYFALYDSQLLMNQTYEIVFVSQENEFSIFTHDIIKSYNNYFRLDYNDQSLKVGKGLVRSILLVASRLIMTLIIEGMIFYKFAFREKKSWLVFLIINLVTQGGLHIWLNSMSPLVSYIIVNLIVAEFFIFIFETIYFMIYLKEKKRIHVFSYVLVANFVSFFMGVLFIPLLPL